MDKTNLIFTVAVVLTVTFSVGFFSEMATAQTYIVPDGEGEYEKGSHEGKSCPSKEGKSKTLGQSL